MNDERRHYSRIAFHAPAQLIFPDFNLESVVLDLSLKGALVRLPAGESIMEGANCTLQIKLNEVDDQISMHTRVTHVEGRYAGLLCQTIDLDSVTHLRRLVELNLGDPNLLERELSTLIADNQVNQ